MRRAPELLIGLLIGLLLVATGCGATDEELDATGDWFTSAPHVASVDDVGQGTWNLGSPPVEVRVTLDQGSGADEVAELAAAVRDRFADDQQPGIDDLTTTVDGEGFSVELGLSPEQNEHAVRALSAASGIEQIGEVEIGLSGTGEPNHVEATVARPDQIVPVAGRLSRELPAEVAFLQVSDGISRLAGHPGPPELAIAEGLVEMPGVDSWSVGTTLDGSEQTPARTEVRVADVAALPAARDRVLELPVQELTISSGQVRVGGTGPLPELPAVLRTMEGLGATEAFLRHDEDDDGAGYVELPDRSSLLAALGESLDPAGADRPVALTWQTSRVVGTRGERLAAEELFGTVSGLPRTSIAIEGAETVEVSFEDGRPETVTPVIEAIREVELEGERTWSFAARQDELQVVFTGGTDGDAHDARHGRLEGPGSDLSPNDQALIDKWDRTP